MQQAIGNRILVLVIAAVWDLAVGDPKEIVHPVQIIGKLIEALEKLLRRMFRISGKTEGAFRISRAPETAALGTRADKEEKGQGDFHRRERIAGLLLTVLVVLISTFCAYLLVRLLYRIHPAVGAIAEGILCGQMLAMKSLRRAAESVRVPLTQGNIEGARRAVSMIVGRDTERLDEAGITRAAIETVAENTSDGVIAPLIFEMLFGAAGAYFYKSINTMDSMIGYKNDRYCYFGTAAAKLDDVVNYLPSRITAVFMIAAARIMSVGTKKQSGPDARNTAHAAGAAQRSRKQSVPDARNAARIWRRDRRKHPSPNSAQAESVCAGALHIALAGPMYYFGELHEKPWIGDNDRKVEPEDIRRSEHLMEGCAMLVFLAGLLMLAVLMAVFTGH